MQTNSNELRNLFIIKTKNSEEEFRIAELIHNHLVGNEDYIECGIILNMSSDRNDGTENETHCYIFNDSKTNPNIPALIVENEGYGVRDRIARIKRDDKTVIIDLW